MWEYDPICERNNASNFSQCIFLLKICNSMNKVPSVTTLVYMVIYYDFILHDLSSFANHQVYLNTKNIRRKGACKHKIFKTRIGSYYLLLKSDLYE